MSTLKTLAAASLIAASGSAAAFTDFYINNGADYGGIGTEVCPECTGIKEHGAISYQSQTLVDLQNANQLTVGDTITTYAGILAGGGNINPQTSGLNQFTAFIPGQPENSNNGLGTNWFMSFYTDNMKGTISDLTNPAQPEVTYTEGTINLLYSTDGIDWTNFMDLIVKKSVYDTANNLSITGTVDFSDVDDLVYKDLFNFADGTSFYDIWLAGEDFDIPFQLDQNLGVPTIDFLDAGTAKIAGTHGAQLYFDTVPEPATLALLGFGLLGFAGARKRRLA
ncbi:PEP-CTERM sorting domain-containing protein [Methylotuvimicrobium alcaliphilum]|jgi:hypothetical protein|uniref:Ice-binding protein C-terminal domain-containing protein n=1 Tax=Methylotuvimicrobium alcaliphilum (strain DSM 19304 / NCIMB 14124 / VKM B-2133 / 20Z) TaxID=1091494 RepID=G4SZN0_META2|nr:PEP-CTERM sorting domain-containing protein [Methylotuvimicrobium alcaliphilum]CCE24471.1 exported protein of unknown function [Methylotuvimicrobium alcaliphilum 20Z]